MKGLKKTSPIELRLGISKYWNEKILPVVARSEFKNILLQQYLVSLLFLKNKNKKLNILKKRKSQVNLIHINSLIKVNKSLMKLLFFRQLYIPKRVSKYQFQINVMANNIRWEKKSWFTISKLSWKSITRKNLKGVSPLPLQTWTIYNLLYEISSIFIIPWLKIKLKHAKYAWNMLINLNTGINTLNFSKFIINCKYAIESTKKHKEVLQTIVYILEFFFQIKRYLLGYQIQATGTIGHHGRAKIETFRDGELSLSTISKQFGYNNIQSITKFGNIGIKFWCEVMTSQKKIKYI